MAESNAIVVSNNLLGYRITDDLIELAIGGALDEVHTHILDRIFNENKEKIIGVYFSDRDYPIVTKKENCLS